MWATPQRENVKGGLSGKKQENQKTQSKKKSALLRNVQSSG